MEKLSGKHLAQISEYLEKKDLKNLLCVKKFRNIILECPELMRKLPVTFKGRVTGHQQFLNNHGNHVMKLDYVSTRVKEISDLENTLQLTTNLESLTFNCSMLYEEQKNPTVALNLNHLKYLNIWGDSAFIILLLKLISESDQLESIEIGVHSLTSYFEFGGDELPLPEDVIDFTEDCGREIQKFVLKQKNLKVLKFKHNAGPLMFADEIDPAAQFQLKEFSTQDSYRPMDILHETNFYRFLESQQHSMEELKIEKVKFLHHDLHTMQLIFQKFQNLKVFKFNFDNVDLNLFKLIAKGDLRMPSVRELYIANGKFSCELLAYILPAFVNVKSLKIDYMIDTHFKVLEDFQNLEELVVTNWHPATLFEVKFPKLKTLVIEKVEKNLSIQIFYNLCQINSQLETLKCFTFKHLSDMADALKFVGNMSNLKECILQYEKDRICLSVQINFEEKKLAVSHQCEERFPEFYNFVTHKWSEYELTILVKPLSLTPRRDFLEVFQEVLEFDRLFLDQVDDQ